MSVDKRHYHEEMTGRGNFALVPNELLYSKVDQQAKWLWVYILMQKPGWESSRNNLARNLNRSKDSISESIKLLIENNMLLVKDGGRGSWDIEILPPSNWKNIVRPDLSGSGPLGVRTSRSPDLSGSGPLEVHISRREEREEIEKPTIEAVYSKWLASIPEIPKFTDCAEELSILMGSLEELGFSSEDLTPGFRRKVLARWKKSKYPERHEELWDRAIGSTFASKVKLADPTSTDQVSKRTDSQISIKTALDMSTSDSDIEDIVAEFERLRGGDGDDRSK